MGRGKSKILGKSADINRVRRSIRAMSKQDENVLITGEAGTGRAMVAGLLHETGNRNNKNFVTIQCSALGDTIDVEKVFGKSLKEGSPNDGTIFKAQDGILYFENVDQLDAQVQNKLYNFISTVNKSALNARIISSADPAIESKIREGMFNNDLFQVLDELRINIPSVRDRKQDVPFVFSHFLDEFCTEFEKPVPTVPYDIFEAILEYDWPGNVAELKNTVRNLVIMSPEGELSPEYLPFRVQPNPLEALASRDLTSAVGEVEKFLIRKALARYEGNQSRAAQLLQVSEATLRYKMKKYGFQNIK
ncbi:sigma-54-dependent Fis family transcriptional regulator [candidate division KSB1 bacterium]|nr:sigma-54-dependent Fis family transcriptional regulator [candidate division KSB1 bacterium]